jgi:hypothetical protein
MLGLNALKMKIPSLLVMSLNFGLLQTAWGGAAAGELTSLIFPVTALEVFSGAGDRTDKSP